MAPLLSANTAPALQRPTLSLHQLLIEFPGGLAESSNFLAFTHLCVLLLLLTLLSKAAGQGTSQA